MRMQRESHPGYTVQRLPGNVGFAIGQDPHVWKTWRMDGTHHAHGSTLNFRTRQEARDDVARRVRFYRSVMRHRPDVASKAGL